MIKFASITNNSKNVVLLVSCDYINKKIRTKVSYVYVLRQYKLSVCMRQKQP